MMTIIMMLMKIVKDCAKNLNLKNVKTKEKNFFKKNRNRTELKKITKCIF